MSMIRVNNRLVEQDCEPSEKEAKKNRNLIKLKINTSAKTNSVTQILKSTKKFFTTNLNVFSFFTFKEIKIGRNYRNIVLKDKIHEY